MKNHLSIVSLFKPLLIAAGFISSSFQAISVEFKVGRTPPAKNNLPTLGSGLAMSKGYYRGSPMGELSGWTLSLWFEAKSDRKGDLLGIVRNENNGEAYRLTYENGAISFGDPKQKKRPWKLVVKGVKKDQWNHVVISYGQATGPTLYLNAEKKAQGGRGQMGYATQFDHYHFGAAVVGKGKYGDYFDGKIDDFELHNRPFDGEEISRLNQGGAFPGSLIAWNDFENVNHRELAYFNSAKPDDDYLEAGRKLYLQNCTSCHSKDGTTPPINPLARSFTKNKMENGDDPHSMFKTLTYGFRNMMPSVQLNPADRYKVIHYLREKIIREKAPELYVKFDQSNTYTMPKSPESTGNEAERIEQLARSGYLRDYGRALISPVVGNAKSNNALTLDLGNKTTISYELGTMRAIGAWTGGFLDFSGTLHHRLRAGGLPSARFESIVRSDGWHWAWDGKAENPIPALFPKTVWPAEQLRYNGHYPFGDETVISYSVQGRPVLESPRLEEIGGIPIIHHRLTINAGRNPLELIVLNDVPKIEGRIATIGHSIAWLQAKDDGVQFRATENGKLVLQIPVSNKPIHLNVALAHDESDSIHDKAPTDQVINLLNKTKGGPRRWNTTHTARGRLATSTFQGYVMDSITVPLKNAYNSWMRTSSLAFFPDGRLAVGTLPGDIWIVSGINDELDKVTWQRFAAGLYEPLGMKVVDGVLTAITRGRIVKLHDYNNDGEADFYQALFNEDEPDKGWHAYNFDLEVGKDGSFYYGRTGGFSEWSVPGGVVKVSADGKSSTVLGAGLRVPNGIGKLPDGRITLGDNQGTYVPASKISITSLDAFHGAGSWTKHGDKYDPEKIVKPIVYMPQELDSSSGGQLWVEKDKRLGPLSGQYFHTSYGKAATMYVMMDKINNVMQGAVYSLPLKMESGTMRAAKSPVDGQLYYSGLTGWQAGATQEGSIQRLRYTGKTGIYLTEAKARKDRLQLTFTEPVSSESINKESFSASAWNYRWSKGYGSPQLRASEPETRGIDELAIDSLELSDDGLTLAVGIPKLIPCHNLKLNFAVTGKNGAELSGPVYFTIHELPES
jgi:mono/diheme cytochrome c family protein